MNPFSSLAIGIGGIILLVLLLKSFGAAKASALVTPTFVLSAAIVLLTNITSTVSQFSGGRSVQYTELRQAIVQLSGPAMAASRIVVPGLISVALVYCLHRFGRGPLHLNVAATFFALILMLGTIASAYQGFPLVAGRSLGYLLAVVAIALAPRNLETLRGAAHAVGLLVALSALVSLVDPVAASGICDARKCGALGGLYNGVSFSFNEFGMLMAVAGPILYFGLSKYKITFVLASAFLGFASGSRSSQLAIAVTLMLLFVHHQSSRNGRKAWTALPVTAAAIALACSVALPLIGLPNEQFTGRVRLWNIGLQEFTESPVIGHGSELWSTFQQTGLIARASAYSTHNQFIDLLFVSGLAGLALYMLATWNVARHNKGNMARLAVLVVPALILGSTERPWSLGDPDWMSWSFLVVLATAFPVQTAGGEVTLSDGPYSARPLEPSLLVRAPNKRSSVAGYAGHTRNSGLHMPRQQPARQRASRLPRP